jgi:tetratricopeptide (TPR) repeat protein
MKEEDKIQLIEDYVNGQLSIEEKADFQQQLQQDPSLAQEVGLYKDIFSGLAIGGRKDMKAHLKALDEKSFSQEAASKLQASVTENIKGKVIQSFWQRNAWLTGIAACLVLGLVAFLWVSNSSSANSLFAKYYAPYPNVVAAVERGETIQDATKQAMQAYESGDYTRAIQGLQQIANNDPEASSLYLYLGISYIETSQLDSAKVYLEKATADAASKLHTQAKWYLALAYLKNKEKEQAIVHLQSLSQESGVYAQKARQLLDDL